MLTNRLNRGFRRLFRGRDTRVRYLLNYADATFTRNSEAAYFDPRTGQFAATGFEAAESFFSTSDFQSSNGWTYGNNASVTADVDGDADEIFDNGALYDNISRIESLPSGLTEGARLRLTVKIKQDADETRFPEIGLDQGSQDFRLQLNTSTGATSYRNSTPPAWFDSSVTDAGDGYWLVTMTRSISGTTGTTIRIYPAIGSSLGSIASGTTGSIIVKDFDASVLREKGWKPANEGRIFSDGSILIEGSRTNAMPDSADMSDPPKDHLNSPVVTDGDDTAPDGSAMDLITFGSGGANGQVRDALDDTLFTDAVDSQFSLFMKGNGSDQLRLYARDKDLQTTLDETITPAAAIERITYTFDNGTGNADLLAGLIEVTDGGAFHAWGWQVEPDCGFTSSPIRTSGAAATRAAETCVIAESDVDPALFSVGFEIDITSIGNSGEFTGTTFPMEVGGGTANAILISSFSQNNFRLVIASSNFSVAVTDGIQAGVKYTLRVRWGDTFSVTQPNGTVDSIDISSGGSWAPGQLAIGARSDSNGPHFAVYSKPRAI